MRFKKGGVLSAFSRYRIQRSRRVLCRKFFQVVPANGRKQLLVDVSVIVMHDAGTGIQRVIRSILHELLRCPPFGYVVRPIGATRKRPYRYVTWDLIGKNHRKEGFVSTQPGDVFLGLELNASMFHAHQKTLKRWKANGVAFHVFVHDILSLRHPEWFSDQNAAAFRKWISVVAKLSNSILCSTEVVKQDVSSWFYERYGITSEQLPVQVIPFGWDFSSVLHSKGYPLGFETALDAIKRHPSALMVGTIEPRKGHADILNAFEMLWQSGEQYNLVIVGRPGWKTEVLQKKLRDHLQQGKHLFWFDDVSDETLLKLYEICDGVIIASLAEGFGLPLIEALGYNKPVLVRDLPVFRERECEGIEFFDSNNDARAMAADIKSWLTRENKVLPSVKNLASWSESAEAIIQLIG